MLRFPPLASIELLGDAAAYFLVEVANSPTKQPSTNTMFISVGFPAIQSVTTTAR